jgi:hypothetical protein
MKNARTKSAPNKNAPLKNAPNKNAPPRNAPSHLHAADLRGAGRLAVDATLGLTSLVETLHHNILRTPGLLGAATQQPAPGITGFVYRSVRGITRFVGAAIDAALRPLEKLLGTGASSPARDAVLAALNGVLGDHLQASGNPLAIRMQWRHAGTPLVCTPSALRAALAAPTGKVLVLVHGLCMDDLQWRRHGHDHGAALAADAGFTPVYLHYNSGLAVGANGCEFAQQLESLLSAWPVPVEQLVILAHSMGGLLARSACHYGELAGHTWRRHLSTIIFLGTPHHGAPLERGGAWVDMLLDASPYTTAFARLGKIRSAGITDLRHGTVLDAPARAGVGRSVNVRLPRGVACHALAACIAKTSRSATALLGDGLVPVASALGRADPARDLHFAPARRWTGYGMNHMDLLDNAEVYEQIRRRV